LAALGILKKKETVKSVAFYPETNKGKREKRKRAILLLVLNCVHLPTFFKGKGHSKNGVFFETANKKITLRGCLHGGRKILALGRS